MRRFLTMVLGAGIGFLAAAGEFESVIQPILEEHCFDCHNGKKKKGDIDLTALPARDLDAFSAEVWDAALGQINNGDMPPAKKPRLAAADLGALTGWLERSLDAAAEGVRAEQAAKRLRRLNRTEYRNTIRDLTGHPFDAAELFTTDAAAHGFDNVGEALQVSPLQIEAFVAAAERVVDKVIDVPAERPEKQHWRIVNLGKSGQKLKPKTGAWHKGHLGKPKNQIKPGRLQGDVLPNAEIPNGSAPYRMVDLSVEPAKEYAGSWDVRAFGGASRQAGNTRANFGFKWFAYDEGIYRLKVRVKSFHPQGRPQYLTVVRYPEGTEWTQEALPPGEHTLTYELYRDEIPWYVKTSGNRHWGLNLIFALRPGKDEQSAHGIHVDWMEVEGPIYPEWPPAFHRRVFPERLAAEADADYAGRVIAGFMARAFRRPVAAEEVGRMVALYERGRAAGDGFFEAMRLPLTTILCAPDFLYLRAPGLTQPAEYALANRLSYFLWRSMPDDELLAVAAKGWLRKPAVLRAQVRRMLQDPRREALVRNFTQQWLGLRKIRNLQADRRLYPTYRLVLQQAMVAESEAFFREVLDERLPLRTFLDADFAMLNDEMARHYGVPGVRGAEFRRVGLKPEHNRGGVLGQAAVLTATANGVRTLPVNRGVFILEEILGSPPPSPPPDVGQLEDVKVPSADATTRARLELHRTNPNCARCHEKIDPLGFALENFDAIGAWRTHEVTFEPPKGRSPGAAIDASGRLPDGREFGGFAELKQLLLADEARFRLCFTEKMLVYALDRPLTFADRRFVQELEKEIVADGATVSAVIEAIVLSETFVAE